MMRPLEIQVVAQLEKTELFIDPDDMIKLEALPLGSFSTAFRNHKGVKRYSGAYRYIPATLFNLRLTLEAYIASNDSQGLESIETAIQQLIVPYFPFDLDKKYDSKALGMHAVPLSGDLIRRVYHLENKPLTDLFQKYFPTPPRRLFGEDCPRIIQEREHAVFITMGKIDADKMIAPITKLQRSFRMKRRYKEEIKRIELVYQEGLKEHNLLAEQFIKDADEPYHPKECDEKLALRIMEAAKKVEGPSSTKHITSQEALVSIFDDCLYGRRTLMDYYLPYRPAALKPDDVRNGDLNVVCLGSQEIDPAARGNITIEFDLRKLIKEKPSAFYKQLDLEFSNNDKVRNVILKNEPIRFHHTGSFSYSDAKMAHLKIMDNESNKLKYYALIPKSTLIAYDLERMHQIHTLNFFRFMDRIKDCRGRPALSYIKEFYKKLDGLSEQDLVAFLTDLHRNMTDTAEFNFYGAHQIDFSTVMSITINRKYTLSLQELIKELKKNDLDALRKARKKIPELFQSYRFLDYLLLQLKGSDVSDIQYYLDDLRKQCKTPPWVRYIPLLRRLEDEYKFDWDVVFCENDIRPFEEKEKNRENNSDEVTKYIEIEETKEQKAEDQEAKPQEIKEQPVEIRSTSDLHQKKEVLKSENTENIKTTDSIKPFTKKIVAWYDELKGWKKVAFFGGVILFGSAVITAVVFTGGVVLGIIAATTAKLAFAISSCSAGVGIGMTGAVRIATPSFKKDYQETSWKKKAAIGIGIGLFIVAIGFLSGGLIFAGIAGVGMAYALVAITTSSVAASVSVGGSIAIVAPIVIATKVHYDASTAYIQKRMHKEGGDQTRRDSELQEKSSNENGLIRNSAIAGNDGFVSNRSPSLPLS